MTSNAYSRWRSTPFPTSSANDVLDELNKDLVYWDVMVAGTIVPVAEQGASYDSGVLDLAQGLAAYRQELVAASMKEDPAEAALIAQHIAFTDLMIAASSEAAGLS